jgi:hypothetical protein
MNAVLLCLRTFHGQIGLPTSDELEVLLLGDAHTFTCACVVLNKEYSKLKEKQEKKETVKRKFMV